MKKTLCILLAVLMIVGLFSGCAGEPGPLRICIDLDQFGNTPMSVVLEDLKWWVEKATGLEKENIVFEIIPDDDAERDTAIDRILQAAVDKHILADVGKHDCHACVLADRQALFLGKRVVFHQIAQNRPAHRRLLLLFG